MNCRARSCDNPAFVCYFPESGDDPLTLCRRCYEYFRKQEAENKILKERREAVTRRLGGDRVSLLQGENDSLLNELHSFLRDEKPDALDFASLLFLAVGSRGPEKNFLESTDFQVSWHNQTLVISVKDQYKGLWIGKGGKYIKAANAILEEFGCFVRIS